MQDVGADRRDGTVIFMLLQTTTVDGRSYKKTGDKKMREDRAGTATTLTEGGRAVPGVCH